MSTCLIEPPRVRAINPIGSGDVAAAANAAVWAPGSCTADQIRALLEAARIIKL